MASFKERNKEKHIKEFENMGDDESLIDVDSKEEHNTNEVMYHNKVDDDVVAHAMSIFDTYRQGKAKLDATVIENEEWYRKRHQKILAEKSALTVSEFEKSPRPNSTWLFNSIMGKHADAMDNFPSAVIQPREKSDEESAKMLTDIIPCVLENSGFDETYDYNWWEKLKHGTGVYGIFFDAHKSNGLGEIVIKPIDLLNIFWENGCRSIQDSPNVFTVSMVDVDLLNSLYPNFNGELQATGRVGNDYHNDDNVDYSNKCMVVDWYYKRYEDGRQILHYAKLCNGKCLFATENDRETYPNGWYEHGLYPFEFDTLYPIKNSCVGEGIISVGKDAQTYIDSLGGAVLQHTMLSAKPKYFMSDTCGVNADDLLDPNKSIVPVQGSIDDSKLRSVNVPTLDPSVRIYLQMKIEELKETTSNRDVNMGGGGSSSGVAISAMQEAGNKTSRDMIASSYRCYTRIVAQVIELMRQFYDEKRTYRIVGTNNEVRYEEFSNEIINYQTSMLSGEELFRKPIFDIKISAQRKNPYTTLSYNNLAKDMFGMGMFNAEMSDQTSLALELMDFEGKDKIEQKLKENNKMLQMIQQLQEQLQQTQMALLKVTGNDMNLANAPQGSVMPQNGKINQTYDVALANMENARMKAVGLPNEKG